MGFITIHSINQELNPLNRMGIRKLQHRSEVESLIYRAAITL